MQLPATQPRKQTRELVDYTPPAHETIILVPPEAGAEMSAVGSLVAGTPYTDANMGQAPLFAERDQTAKATFEILRDDSIRLKDSEKPDSPSRPDSWSMHCDYTNQAPYNDMNTADSLLRIPTDNPSHDLAFFLRTTGPVAPHRRPSKVETSARETPIPTSDPKDSSWFQKLRNRRQQKSVKLEDVGGLLQRRDDAPSRTPTSVEQKVSSTGKRYFALKAPLPAIISEHYDVAPTLSPSIVESRVSISFPESIDSLEKLHNWVYPPYDTSRYSPVSPMEEQPLTWNGSDGTTVGADDMSPTPVRPRASNPPTPEPVSAVSMAESYQNDLAQYPAQRSFEVCRALSNHPVHSATPSSLQSPKISLPRESVPMLHPAHRNEVDIEHPCPRRHPSHTMLLQRASSVGDSLYRRSTTDSPGPPPRSPLRPGPDSGTIEGILASYQDRGPIARTAPSIIEPREFQPDLRRIRPTVVTDCTGPIKRPRSRGKDSVVLASYKNLRREREERTRARKLRDRPSAHVPITTSEANVSLVQHTPGQKLRKARPHIQIPSLRPAPLRTHDSSTASSSFSWRKDNDVARTPISPVSSKDTPPPSAEKTGYTPISATASARSANAEAKMQLSPVMLVAEEMPVQKAKSTPKPARIVVKEGKSYTPRPRSASIPRSAMKRRSRQGGSRTPSRPASPAPNPVDEYPPPLPSPPPNRALPPTPIPPTPPASGSEKASKSRSARLAETKKELPALPVHEITPQAKMLAKRNVGHPHVATQRRSGPWKESLSPAQIQARLEALERQNVLLNAALNAVLLSNGSSNVPWSELAKEGSISNPMSWESRIARRSAAGHSHSNSQSSSSALEMYKSTRRGSKHGR